MRPKLGVDYVIRPAYPFEGPVIGNLYDGTLVAGINWEHPLDASWVIAVHPQEPEYFACLSLVASQPIGRLEMLRVRPQLSKRLKAVIVRDMIHYGLLVLKQYGCQAVSAYPRQDPTNMFGKVVQRHFHGQEFGTHTGYLARL